VRPAHGIVERRLGHLKLRDVEFATLNKVNDCPAIRGLLLSDRYRRSKGRGGDVTKSVMGALVEVNDSAQWRREYRSRRLEVDNRLDLLPRWQGCNRGECNIGKSRIHYRCHGDAKDVLASFKGGLRGERTRESAHHGTAASKPASHSCTLCSLGVAQLT